MSSFWIVLVAKAAAAGLLVVAASMAVERSGPFVGAMIASLPISAGPAYLFLALDHDAPFLAESGPASILSVCGTCVFIAVYAAAARRLATPSALAVALGAWLLTVTALNVRSWSLGETVAVGTVVWAGASLATRHARAMPVRLGVRASPTDIAIRASAVGLLIVAVTLTGRWLGPHAAGLAALAPIVFASLAAILQPRIGGEATGSMMAHAVTAMFGYVVGFGLLGVAATRLGSWTSLGLALAACLAWNGVLIGFRRARVRAAKVAHTARPA